MNTPLDVKTVTVIIPAYNEEETISELVQRIKKTSSDWEILVVDDGSVDKTSVMARSAGAKVIRHPYNVGNGAAIKTGIRKAQGKQVVLLDADGQHQPEDIMKLLENLNEYDMVVGARTNSSNVSTFRSIGNWILIKVANYLSGKKIADLTSGFRAIHKEKIMEFLHLLPNEFSYPTTSTLAFLKSGYTVKYVPLDTIRRRSHGKSKVNPLNDGFKFIMIIIRIIMLFAPLKVFFPASLILSTLGFIWMLIQIGLTKGIQGSSLLIIIIGVLIFFFGLLADQNAQIRREIKSGR